MKKLILLLLLVCTAHAEDRIYGVYTSLEVNQESGDIGGMELFIIHNGSKGECGDSVLVQVAEGWLKKPYLVDCCHCSKDKVSFDVPDLGTFEGAILNGALEGKFINSGWSHSLQKGQSFWQ